MRIPGVPYVQGGNDYDDQDGLHYGFAIHNTANDADDEDEASYAKHRPDGVSSHFYVDDNSVTQSLDTVDRAGHAGSANGNNNAIAFEFTGTNSKSRAWWLANIAWERVGYVIAYIIEHDPDYKGFQVRRASVAEMKANPRVKAFYGHDDMRRAWGGTTHTDPGPNFPWDRLFSSVNAALGNSTEEEDDMFSDSDRLLLKNLSAAVFTGGPSCGTVVDPGNGRGESNSMVNKADELLKRSATGAPVVVNVDELVARLGPALVELVRAEVRDAVADLGEGGSKQVRAD